MNANKRKYFCWEDTAILSIPDMPVAAVGSVRGINSAPTDGLHPVGAEFIPRTNNPFAGRDKQASSWQNIKALPYLACNAIAYAGLRLQLLIITSLSEAITRKINICVYLRSFADKENQ
ncbi:MAG TPA: hypothetical protein ENJ11_01835 [Gammaproteobacteria bacterium]|nr:hypothetical protein [Gammaproteobacteria bacterium]